MTKRPKQKIFPTRKKKPKNIYEPILEKYPHIDKSRAPESSKQKCPVWRIVMLDFGGKSGWSNVRDISVILEIQTKLKNYESMTWAEIEQKTIKKGTQQNHFIQVNRINKEAQKRYDPKIWLF